MISEQKVNANWSTEASQLLKLQLNAGIYRKRFFL